jgi:hypothetical protein
MSFVNDYWKKNSISNVINNWKRHNNNNNNNNNNMNTITNPNNNDETPTHSLHCSGCNQPPRLDGDGLQIPLLLCSHCKQVWYHDVEMSKESL